MSKVAHAYADDKPGADLPNEAPAGQVNDPSYKTKGSTEAVPVIDDDAPVEDPIRPEEADSDKQLGKKQQHFDRRSCI